MNEGLLTRTRVWRDQFFSRPQATVDWDTIPVFVRCGHTSDNEPYVAMMHTPPCWLHEDVTGLHVNPLAKAAPEDVTSAAGRGFWVRLHGYDPQGAGLAAFVVANGVDEWVITRGADGRLVGARLSHLMTPKDFKLYQDDDIMQAMLQMGAQAPPEAGPPQGQQ
jgi:hypothetical protein